MDKMSIDKKRIHIQFTRNIVPIYQLDIRNVHGKKKWNFFFQFKNSHLNLVGI